MRVFSTDLINLVQAGQRRGSLSDRKHASHVIISTGSFHRDYVRNISAVVNMILMPEHFA
jgi:hypothetical protein